MFSSFIIFGQLNPQLLQVNFQPIVNNQTVDIKDINSLFSSNDDDSLISLGSDGYTQQGDTCANDKATCEIKRDIFIQDNQELISSGKIKVSPQCLYDTTRKNEYCMYVGKQENIGENATVNKEYGERRKEAQDAGFEGETSLLENFGSVRANVEASCNAKVQANSYYGSCKCRKKPLDAGDDPQ